MIHVRVPQPLGLDVLLPSPLPVYHVLSFGPLLAPTLLALVVQLIRQVAFISMPAAFAAGLACNALLLMEPISAVALLLMEAVAAKDLMVTEALFVAPVDNCSLLLIVIPFQSFYDFRIY